MSKRKMKPPISDLLRKTIARSGVPLLVLQRETGVERTCIMRFVRGEQMLRLDKADALAQYFGLRLAEDSRRKTANPRPGHGRKGTRP